MSEPARIADQIRRAARGAAWHGPPLAEVLDDVTAAEAAQRPVAGAHSIWELVGHLVTWTNTVRLRLGGLAVEPDEADNFPEPEAATPAAWSAACDAVLEAHETLAAAVEALSDDRLEARVPGQSYTAYVMVHGAIQHTLYHVGQIAVLKRALGTHAP